MKISTMTWMIRTILSNKQRKRWRNLPLFFMAIYELPRLTATLKLRSQAWFLKWPLNGLWLFTKPYPSGITFL